MIVAELRVVTLGEGTSQEAPVAAAVRVLEERGFEPKVGPMGTVIESESLEDILLAVEAAHAKLRQTAGRIVTEITIDERLDHEETAESLSRIA
ncbi:MAG TPA: thiamine-binding protein [Candidatus Thermoplasmatota archaeon]|nr:thiamine-binding protein [Candidatus Thermoplasmatota archaeon]